VNFRSIKDLTKAIYSNMPYLPRDIDIIVGVPRSGMLPASMLALYMNKPLVDFDGYLSNRTFDTGNTRKRLITKINNIEHKKILIVDDSINKGIQLKICKERIKETIPNNQDTILWCAVYGLDENKDKVDFCFEICEQMRIFEWNMMAKPILASSCMDIDDVMALSNSRTKGNLKLQIPELKPLYLPSRKVGHLVTCRLEKDREATVKWLQKYNIKYDELHMMKYNTPEERRRDGMHAKYKADIYKRTGCKLFIESSEKQAIEIHRLTRKPVICTDNMVLYKIGN